MIKKGQNLRQEKLKLKLKTLMLCHKLYYLGGRHHTESVHDTVRVLFADLADEQGSHTGSSSTTKRVGELEALQTVTAL